MKVTPLIWMLWIASCLVSFAFLEGIALYNRFPNDTLTGVIAKKVPWYLALGLLVFAVIAALGHWWRAYHDKGDMRLPRDG